MAAPTPIDANPLASRHPGPSRPRRTPRIPNEPSPISGHLPLRHPHPPNRHSSPRTRIYQTNPKHLSFSITYILTTNPTNPTNPCQPSTPPYRSAILSSQEGPPCAPFPFV